jgi:hypothetical protein
MPTSPVWQRTFKGPWTSQVPKTCLKTSLRALLNVKNTETSLNRQTNKWAEAKIKLPACSATTWPGQGTFITNWLTRDPISLSLTRWEITLGQEATKPIISQGRLNSFKIQLKTSLHSPLRTQFLTCLTNCPELWTLFLLKTTLFMSP